MAKVRSHQIRTVVRAVTETPWAILPETMDTVCEVLDARAVGELTTEQQLTERLGLTPAPAEDRGIEVVDGVAVLSVAGVLSPRMNLIMRISGGTSVPLLGGQFDQAIADDAIKAIVLRIDSPGGSALGIAELAAKIYAARGRKPIVAVADGGVAASAAFWIAAAADEIVASAGSMLGSIGVMHIHRETSAADTAAGLKYTILSAGEFKAVGNAREPLGEAAKATLQERVDDFYRLFVMSVAEYRGTTPADVLQNFGQGKVYLASRALKANMIDRIGTLAGVLSELRGAGPGRFRIAAQTDNPTNLQLEVNSMDPELREFLVSRHLVEPEASDPVCEAWLRAWATARGETRPITVAILEAGLAAPPAADDPPPDPEPAPPPTTATDPTPATTPAPAATVPADQQTIEQRAAIAERNRVLDLEARAGQIGIGPDDLRVAIESGTPADDAMRSWVRRLATDRPPVTTDTGGQSRSAVEQFVQNCQIELLARFGLGTRENLPAAASRDLSYLSLAQMGEQMLAFHGVRRTQDREMNAVRFLELGGASIAPVAAASVNNPADHPNLLASLVGTTIDQAIDLAEVTYSQWAARLADVDDFKPRDIVSVGAFDALDEIGDDDDPLELSIYTEEAAWYQVGQYANKVGLTPRMVVDDKLDGFGEALRSLGFAHENTINRLCVALLTTNVTLVDGNSLFDDTNHGNDRTSGGAPSITEMDEMRKKHRAQTGVGGVGFVKTPPRIALVPNALETDAEQVFLPMAEPKRPATDATINTFRGKVRPVVEGELDSDSTTKWYTLADPMIRRTIAYVFQRGYGAGQRTTWLDPARGTRYYKIEGRFASVAITHRGIVRNAGA